MDHHIDFSNIDWTNVAEGFRFKIQVLGTHKVRIAEFSEGLVEPDWCRHGHTGYILDGECKINFNGKMESFKKGDIFHIPTGEEDKHMVTMDKGGWVQILLFELL